jgi:GMP synthase (glutamine-hydrolysing)
LAASSKAGTRASSAALMLRSRKHRRCLKASGRWARKYPVWMSHGDRVTSWPKGFEVVATSENAPFAIAVDEKRKFYTTMFHPEVVHTPDGAKLLAQLHAQNRRL